MRIDGFEGRDLSLLHIFTSVLFRLIFETHLPALRFPSSRKDFRAIVPIRSETLLGKSKVAKGDMSEPLSHGNGISS